MANKIPMNKLLYEFTIYADRENEEPFYTTTFAPLPNSIERWQFKVACTSPSGDVISLMEFYRRRNSEIHVWLFKREGNISKTIEWVGIMTLRGFSCVMESSSIEFHLKYEQLIQEYEFVFKRKRGMSGKDYSDICVEFKVEFIWDSRLPNHSISKQSPKPLTNNNSVLKVFKHMYSDAILADVVFTIGDTKLSAHKCVLGSHSDVFHKMFEADMLEKSSNCIPIVDCDVQTFSQFLQFLYTGKLDDNLQSNMVSLFAVADKYNIKDLRMVCVKKMCSSIAADNVVNILVSAYLHDEKEMEELAKTFIRDNIVSVACRREWGEMLITYPDLAEEIEIKITTKHTINQEGTNHTINQEGTNRRMNERTKQIEKLKQFSRLMSQGKL